VFYLSHTFIAAMARRAMASLSATTSKLIMVSNLGDEKRLRLSLAHQVFHTKCDGH
jgi:hypothetical protein